jgi:hypothetical protein
VGTQHAGTVAYSLDIGEWIFRRFDTKDDETSFSFHFLHWATVDNRDDFAAIQFDEPWETGSGALLETAYFAVRHVGVNLRHLSLSDLPTHAYLMTTRATVDDDSAIDPNGMVIRAWAQVEPKDWHRGH